MTNTGTTINVYTSTGQVQVFDSKQDLQEYYTITGIMTVFITTLMCLFYIFIKK